MNQTKIEQEVLSLATEDWSDLWDLTSICSRMFPEADAQAIQKVVAVAVRQLFDRGMLELCWFAWEEQTREPLRPDEVVGVLADSSRWVWTESLPNVRPQVSATDEGMDKYFGSRQAWAPRKNPA